MSPLELITIEEWDALIKQHSLHLKYDSQLFFLEESIEAKIPRVNRDLMEILLFPDAKKKEICQNYIEAGEVTNYFDLETPVPISLKDKEKIDAEYVHEVDFYTTKLDWLKQKFTCCQKEMELRADKLVERTPKGTPYFVDFTNGHDVDNDGTTAVKGNGDGPWATLDKCGSTLTAGDVATVRRGMTQTVSADLAFANDGTMVAPITITADYSDTTWTGGKDNTVATETATFTFGSKIVTFAGDISGDIAAGDWIYESTEVASDWAYEVASVSGGSNEIVTLYLPYKGAISGAGKTVNIMPDNPIWNTAAGDYEVNLDADVFWFFQGMHFRGTDSNGVMEVDNVRYVLRRDCIFEGNGAGDYCTRYIDSAAIFDRKCRYYNGTAALNYYSTYEGALLDLRDCYIDCTTYGIMLASTCEIFTSEVEVVNVAGADIYINCDDLVGQTRGKWFRNNKMDAFQFSDAESYTPCHVEDYNQTVGDNRQYGIGSTVSITLQSETTKVRAGGGTTSIKVTPTTNLSSAWEASRILIFEYPIYAVKDVEKTYTVYLSSDDDTDWDADPLNTELWIEAEYWGHATNVHRKILKSTEVCNNFDADDTVWDTLTVAVTPLQTGVLYLRGYYCKPKEATNSNIFYCDTVVGVA